MTYHAWVGRAACLSATLVLGGCFASRAPAPSRDNSGCFQGAYSSAASAVHLALRADPVLVATQRAGLHVAAFDAGPSKRALNTVLVWIGADEESRPRRTRPDGWLTVVQLLPGITEVRTRVFGFEPSKDSVRLRAGYIDTLVLRRGYVGNECLIVPDTQRGARTRPHTEQPGT